MTMTALAFTKEASEGLFVETSATGKYYRAVVVGQATETAAGMAYWVGFNWGAYSAAVDSDTTWSKGQVLLEGPFPAWSAAMSAYNRRLTDKRNSGYHPRENLAASGVPRGLEDRIQRSVAGLLSPLAPAARTAAKKDWSWAVTRLNSDAASILGALDDNDISVALAKRDALIEDVQRHRDALTTAEAALQLVNERLHAALAMDVSS